MYALENVNKFVRDNTGRLGDRIEGILVWAENCSQNGVISGGAIEDVMRDDTLSNEFHQIVMSDPEHMKIGLSAIQSIQ